MIKTKSLLIDFEEGEFDSLCKLVSKCRKCSRMNGSQRVLNHSAGNLKAKVMFIGEAPGRFGADDSGIPFHGDKAGHNFEELLEFAGISREDIFVTNSVLCNPKDKEGNNSTPNDSEIENCSNHLQQQIQIINPKIVVTLGGVALEATRLLEQHGLLLKTSVRTSNKWFGRLLIPLYHPGQRAMLHRSFSNQRSDYQFITEQLNRLGIPNRRNTNAETPITIAVIVEYILNRLHTVSYFALHKLFYLIEYAAHQNLGRRLTGAYIIRQKDGPYCTDLHLAKLKKSIPSLQVHFRSNNNIVLSTNTGDLFQDSLLNEFEISEDARMLIDKVLEMHGKKSNTALKRTVYFSRPMRNFLVQEREANINLYNAPIIFETQSAF